MRYCLRVNPDFNWFSLHKWVLIQVCRKLPVSYQLQLSSRAPRSMDLFFALLDCQQGSWNQNLAVHPLSACPLWLRLSHLTWSYGSKISKCFSYKSQPKVFRFFWNFFSMVLTKLLLWILKFWVYDFFFKNFQFTILPYGDQKAQLSGKQAIVEENRVKFGTHGYL